MLSSSPVFRCHELLDTLRCLWCWILVTSYSSDTASQVLLLQHMSGSCVFVRYHMEIPRRGCTLSTLLPSQSLRSLRSMKTEPFSSFRFWVFFKLDSQKKSQHMCWLRYFHFKPAQLLRMLRVWPLLDLGIKKEYLNKASFYLRRDTFFWNSLKYHTWLPARFGKDRWEVKHIPSIMPIATVSSFIIWAITCLWEKKKSNSIAVLTEAKTERKRGENVF